jgi:hypothetical protein
VAPSGLTGDIHEEDGMDGMESIGVLGFILAVVCLGRINNLEKKLKQFDVIPRDFNSEKEPKEAESE